MHNVHYKQAGGPQEYVAAIVKTFGEPVMFSTDCDFVCR